MLVYSIMTQVCGIRCMDFTVYIVSTASSDNNDDKDDDDDDVDDDGGDDVDDILYGSL